MSDHGIQNGGNASGDNLQTAERKRLALSLTKMNVKDSDPIELFFHTLIDSLLEHSANFTAFSSSLIIQIPTLTSFISSLPSPPPSLPSLLSLFPSDHTPALKLWLSVLHRVLSVRSSELIELSRSRTAAISSIMLKDFDWSVRLVVSSDKLATVRIPILLLSLIMIKSDGTRTSGAEKGVEKELVTLELNYAQLCILLDQCNEIQQCIQSVS